MAKKQAAGDSAPAIEYVRWVYPERRAVMGYGILEPGSVHRVADLPGNPLLQPGFEPASAEEHREAMRGDNHE